MNDKPAARRGPHRGRHASQATDALSRYQAKRDFTRTDEPPPEVPRRRAGQGLSYVIQKHWASHLHYDFRLELDGVLVSWAVPKGPSLDPAVKRMAIHVEDHPVAYGSFEGRIPKGQYGGGDVIVWDRGTWQPEGDARTALMKGKLAFELHGEKLAGRWELVRTGRPGDNGKEHWLLMKRRGDAFVRPSSEYDVTEALPDSVIAQPLGPARAAAPPSPDEALLAPELELATDAALPERFAPQLATLVSEPPGGEGWIVENKFDGYRMLCRLSGGKARLLTRNGNDWTDKLQSLVPALEALGIHDAWLDGEIVVLGEAGVPEFNRLQNAIDNARSEHIVYYLFDVPYLSGKDLRQVPLAARRHILGELLRHGPQGDGVRVKFSEAFDETPQQLLEAACRIGLEGVMLKRADAPYVSARTDTWLKLKCQQRQEFVVLGFTDRTNASAEVGSMLLGYHRGEALQYAGAVGTGWNTATGKELHRLLSARAAEKPPIDPKLAKPGRGSRRTVGAVHWVRPEVVVEVAFGEWTPDGHIRHASFRGVRSDKPQQDITREEAVPAQDVASGAAPRRAPASTKAKAKSEAPAVASIKVTNPDRVIDPSTGLKKIDLVRYYEAVAPHMLPHLVKRPVSLVRAPQGIDGPHFFQKHLEGKIAGMTELDAALWPGHDALMSVDSAQALVAAAQMNTVEFHTWNSTVDRIDEPDRIVFDLDPGEGVAWTAVQEGAQLVQALLDELGLQAWLKTSGGKGLHVVVPLKPELGYDVVKGFSQAVTQHIAQTLPQRFVAKSGGSNRVGKVFIDYLRNGHSQTTAAAFSARARPGLGVSMPLAWDELGALKSGAQFTIANAMKHLERRKADPWADYAKSRQTLQKAMQKLQT